MELAFLKGDLEGQLDSGASRNHDEMPVPESAPSLYLSPFLWLTLNSLLFSPASHPFLPGQYQKATGIKVPLAKTLPESQQQIYKTGLPWALPTS